MTTNGYLCFIAYVYNCVIARIHSFCATASDTTRGFNLKLPRAELLAFWVLRQVNGGNLTTTT
ncbi:hypothetical protein DPMN_101251 [Dreissena polymorpha]|uniref:Uncharacterized protein n=1 Tax=Dreissena polymorpha TaxID=45954 RepID=A0A9D4LHC6_DREPO|nr:hypothetical protein DPMN_101251 [Dreissena polymorpha]